MGKTIVIIGTLDTKGEELKYVKELIEVRGHKTIVIDGGILGEPLFQPDISHEEVAEAAGTNLKEMITLGDEGKAIALMAEGASKIAQRLYSEGRLDGIIGLGGTMGSTLALTVMKTLPLGMPKLIVSPAMLDFHTHPQLLGSDITLMPAMADFWGLNAITRGTLENAAGAISGMVETYERKAISEKPLIGITTLGTAVCKHVLWAKPLLEKKGYDVAVFIGYGSTFEESVEQGLIAGSLDFMACAEFA